MLLATYHKILKLRLCYSHLKYETLVCGTAQYKNHSHAIVDKINFVFPFQFSSINIDLKIVSLVKPSKRMRIDSEEEEEEDSDMDDFIDDGDDPALDVSKEIQSLFGYNRNK